VTAPGTVLGMALLATLVAIYYGVVVRLVGEPVARRVLTVVAGRSTWARTRSIADLDGVIRLLLAGLMQLSFVATIIALFAVQPSRILPGRPDPVLIGFGVVLGVAEAALGTQLAFLASRVADALRRGGQPLSLEAWLTVARGGWMRYYLRTAATAPFPVLALATTLYVVGEELVFRGVVLGVGVPALGPVVAGCLSVVLFVLAQVFYTPGWRTALFPMVGALAIGVIHACLFVLVPDITPLIVAHVVMFLVAVL
jgi:hypothetical protein